MAVPDFFTPQAFQLITLTAVINKQPYKPGFLSALGLFQEEGVATRSVFVEEKNGVLRILSTKPWDGPRNTATRERRKVRPFTIPHIPDSDFIRASEVQGVRQFGSEDQLATMEYYRDERLGKMANNMDLTLEYHRMGAVKGIVYDADGTSVLHNCYTEFGVSAPATVQMDLENASPASGAVRKKIAASIVRPIRKTLGDVEASDILVLCGDNFFDDLIAHPEVRQTYQYQEGQKLREGYTYEQVKYGGATWVNYRSDGFQNGAGNPAFVESDYAYALPLGVSGMFITRFAPAEYFETVNTIGLPRYAKAKADDWNRFIEMESESNPLNLNTRPDGVLKLYKATGG